MKFGLLMSATMLATFAFASYVTPTWAGSSASNYNITLTMQQSGCTEPPAGPCAAGENYCESGDCYCCTYTGTASGTAGKGTVTFYETVDTDHGQDGAGFNPMYGEIDIDGSKDTETVSIFGGDLRPEDVISGSTAANTLNGVCIIQASDVFTGGFAKCSGSYSATSKMKFTIKGMAAKK